MEEQKDSKKPEPAFDKQLENYASESIDPVDPIFSGRYFTWITEILRKRDTTVKDELVKEVRNVMDEKFADHISLIETKVNLINQSFQLKMIADVTEIIKKQWPNSLNESLKDYTKARDRKLLKYVVFSGIVVIIISVSVGLAIFIWWHNKYYPENPKPLSMLLNYFGWI